MDGLRVRWLPYLEWRGSKLSSSVGTKSGDISRVLQERVERHKSVALFGICVNRMKLTEWELELSTTNVEKISPARFS